MSTAKSRIPVFITAVFLLLSVCGCGLPGGSAAAPSAIPPSSPPAPSTIPPSSTPPAPSTTPLPSYQSRLNTIQADATLSDSDKISRIVGLFFAARAENFKDDGNGVDLSVFLSGSGDKFDRNKIVNFANLSREGRKLAGLKITSDSLKLMIYKIALQDNAATVSMGELYTYQIEGLKDPSAQRFGYNVLMTKDNGSWLISKIVTDNEAFTNELGSDAFNVGRTLQEGLASIKAESTKGLLSKTPAPASSADASSAETSFHPINRSDAASYAMKYALTYNSGQFISWAPYGGDCADFASQCVWYGMGGREVSAGTYMAPMNALWNMASDGNPKTGSFISMSAFHAMMNTDYPAATPHLSGDCYAQGGIANACPGDIIQIYNGSKWFHTYVVSSVTGSPGARMPSDIQISAHNSDIQNVNFYLQWAQGHPNAYRLIQVNGAYY